MTKNKDSEKKIVKNLDNHLLPFPNPAELKDFSPANQSSGPS